MGTISRDAILHDAVVAEEETYLSGLMQRNFVHVGSHESVDKVITLIQENNIDALLVIDDEKASGNGVPRPTF